MKKITSLILVLCTILMLCSCKEVEKSQGVVNTFFTALQNNDQETVKSCIINETDEANETDGTDETENTINDDGEAYENWDFADYFSKAFTKITYTIASAEQDESDKNRVNVTVDVNAVDMATLFSDAMTEAINDVFSEMLWSNDTDIDVSNIANDYFAKSLEKEDLPYKTTTVTIPVIKTENGMKINSNEELGDAVTGGLFSLTSDLSQSAN